MSSVKTMACFVLVFLAVSVACFAEEGSGLKTKDAEKIEQMREDAERAKREAYEKANAQLQEELSEIDLPEDTTQRMTAREISIRGNSLIPTAELLGNMPLIYNASAERLQQAESDYLYDFRVLHDIILEPGQPHEVSTRTIQGFTQYIVSAYGKRNYAGIYVSVPPEALVDGTKLRDEILLIDILEAPLSSISTNYFNPDNERVEKGYLKSSALMKWSPAQTGEVGNQKKLDDFVNLLNLNPDRYISAVVSQGEEEQTLALGYNIYEANPWHYFLQADNAGTDDRQWTPRVGILNTNLTGIDDRFTVFYQAPWEKGIEDRYSVYGNYDLPIMGPKLRLELYSGYSQFDVDGGGGIDFLGHGSLYGGKLRYNAFQDQGWFFDLTTSLGHEKSRVTSSIFNSILGSEVSMDLWGIGFDLYRRDDMSSTSVTVDRIQSVGGSSQRKFWDTATLTGARTNSDRDFTIYTTSANHSRYLDADKINRLSGSLRWLVPNERLVPAKMTTFGGMYSVRGYKESRIVADGGVLASVQYEYDLVRHDQAKDTSKIGLEDKPWLNKLAPLAFFDYGRAKVKSRVVGEQGSQDLYSVGVGTLVEIGDNFSGALYYGYPLESTTTTDEGDGRINISVLMRF